MFAITNITNLFYTQFIQKVYESLPSHAFADNSVAHDSLIEIVL